MNISFENNKNGYTKLTVTNNVNYLHFFCKSICIIFNKRKT